MREPEEPGRLRFEPEVPDADLDRQWFAVRERSTQSAGRRARRWLWPALSAAALAVAVVIVAVSWREGTPSTHAARSEPPGAPTVDPTATSSDPSRMFLEDGSLVELEPGGEVRAVRQTDASVRVALERGAALFDVSRDPDRVFTVTAQDVTVRVIGTRFRVSVGDPVLVEVTRGVVEVELMGERTRIRAGERWSSEAGLSPMHGPPDDADEREGASPGNEADAHEERAAGVEEDRGRTREARSDRSASEHDPARALFESAMTSRGQNPNEAARMLDELCRRYPRDARVGLAAFELGRLRQDVLRDPNGAVRAYQLALRRAGPASLREDALARLVSAHDQAGDRSACQRARRRYESAHPAGVHRAEVAQHCP